ncbi:NADH-FMN oxidoreductase RutF, flavin reductase (DIM6/NTAB) family [Paraburkholderia phenazinium]|jgi:flavin reductase (DIM6/NTAB) family NADH-FMN oxidoreductase RutF|uniref:NADH-FMN oxidoreductase RutF, flavin reductase (DIM6/NTAB) family n=1 Tax=Paraburkholderia phenazinium TaxID=60549 RepID=A0A1G7YXG6_9BURK|nr:flavin reductase family protein [Paraburkholderia phenazinium]SDH01203.1 NADH-FMN oxidoreductase RutF, flavin reductase (DIM6/NTAB) family [Paraburkholderia phenazinium]
MHNTDMYRDNGEETVNMIEVPARSMYYGTPVALITTSNADGSENITPMSSSWSLRNRIVLGIGLASQAAENLAARPELAIGLPDASLWSHVEKLSALTGKREVPAHKAALFHSEPDKWSASGFTRLASQHIGPGRIAECPLQMEAVVESITPVADDPEGFAMIVARVLAMYAHESVVKTDSATVDPARWTPLVFSYGSYRSAGVEVGKMKRAVRR